MRPHTGRPAVVPILLLAVILVLAGCTSFSDTLDSEASSSAAASPSAEPEAAPIEWSDCDEEIQPLVADRPGSDRDLAFECGRTEVPISYEEPEGATLPLSLVRARIAGQTDRIGSLMVNPGGPGASGVYAAIGLALTLPESVLRRFDLVGFDPRGVSSSTPVECIPAELKDRAIAAEPRPTTAEELDEAFALTREVAEGCAEQYGDALGTFNTVDTARDMDRLRQALDEEQLNFLGYSYGTTLGSTYAELFPDRVRAMVLDAAVDPDADPLADAEAGAKAFEAGFDAFAKNCTGLIAGCPLGAEPRQYVERLLGEADKTPIPSSERGETRTATAGVVMTAIQAALYNTESWPQLAQSLKAASEGDAKGLFTLADDYTGRLEDDSYSNLLDASVAINCADTEQTFEETEVRALVAEWSAKYPFFGAGAATGLYTCSVWEAERTPLPERDAEGSAPIVVIGNTGDPVTPLPGARDLAADLDSGVLVTWQNAGHTAYPRNGCINDAVNAYLVNLEIPKDGLTCPA